MKGYKMTTLKLNASKRKLATKVFHRHFQNEENILRTAFYEKRKLVDTHIDNAFKTAQQIIERTFPKQDVEDLKRLQKKHDNISVVRKDACFHFKSDKGQTKENWQGQNYEVFPEQHFSFELDANINGQRHSHIHDGLEFACAYYHDELKNKGLTPELYVQKGDKMENPHFHVCKENVVDVVGRNKDHGLSKEWYEKYALDVIGSSYCGSRIIQATHDEFEIMQDMIIAKQSLVQAYHEWQGNIIQRTKLVEDTLKQYTTFDQIKVLADKQDIEISEHDICIETTNLALYNPDNVSAMLDDLKPKAKETRAEKIARVLNYQNQSGAMNG
jgi:hypothetical protein